MVSTTLTLIFEHTLFEACHFKSEHPHQIMALNTPLGITTHLGLTSAYT